MHENHPPGEVNTTHAILTVTVEAREVFESYIEEENSDPALLHVELFRELIDTNPSLAYASFDISDHLDMIEDQRDRYFNAISDGYCAAYKLFGFQAEEAGEELPEVIAGEPDEDGEDGDNDDGDPGVNTIQSFFRQFSMTYLQDINGLPAYFDDRVAELKDTNPEFLDAMTAYINMTGGLDKVEAKLFRLGSIFMHDLLSQQTRRNDVLVNYEARVN